ncbi:hypothetical protein C1645_749775 [Glomus cerebriforme]|uniref:Uncharacterized protein n=1 Tax=Glomus cerebriforme TaxID=658196 RepID=A0A397TKF7_9GLOM|nr:hypothetical protein C1645_749775 [Glomus cerebriforme]
MQQKIQKRNIWCKILILILWVRILLGFKMIPPMKQLLPTFTYSHIWFIVLFTVASMTKILISRQDHNPENF